MKHEETLTATLQAQRDSEKMMIQKYNIMIHREQQNQNL